MGDGGRGAFLDYCATPQRAQAVWGVQFVDGEQDVREMQGPEILLGRVPEGGLEDAQKDVREGRVGQEIEALSG